MCRECRAKNKTSTLRVLFGGPRLVIVWYCPAITFHSANRALSRRTSFGAAARMAGVPGQMAGDVIPLAKASRIK